MKYMGSKRAMLQNGLGKMLSSESKGMKRIVDLFSGSASVAWFASQRFPIPVLATDLQQYAAILANAVIGRTTSLSVQPTLHHWKQRAKNWRKSKGAWREAVELDSTGINTRTWAAHARELCEHRRPRYAPIWKAYGGYYFSPRQALVLDSFRATLPKHDPQRTACLAALIMAASKCIASPGHTAQPFKASATAGHYLREAWLREPHYYLEQALRHVFSLCAKRIGRAKVADANEEVRNVTDNDLVFIDPPYSGVQYSRFYHVLETIAAGNCGEVTGTGRYPPIDERPGSCYSRRSQAEDSFTALISALADRGATAIVTFPSYECSNGLSGTTVEEICAGFFHVNKHSVTTHFSTMGGNNTHRSARRPSEELILILSPDIAQRQRKSYPKSRCRKVNKARRAQSPRRDTQS